MKLYVMPDACSLASHIALRWAGTPFDLAIMSHAEAGGEAFRRLNPKGAVPTLVLDDGTVLTESLAVLQYVADRFPAARLGANPGDAHERAKLNEALADLVSEVHKAWAPVFVPDRYVTRPDAQDAVREAAFRQLDRHYARFDAMMADRDWVVLDRRTVADAYLYVMCRWKDRLPTPLDHYPTLMHFRGKLEADPDVLAALAGEGG